MDQFELLARPWWVNLVIVIPFALYAAWRRRGLAISGAVLAAAAAFGAAFGFVEASVVVYLRAAVGLLPGYGGSLGDVARLSSRMYQQAYVLGELPRSLVTIEFFREAATMIMLAMVAILAARPRRERWAVFFWTFAIWDLSYYAGLWATIRWPSTFFTQDVLFLIPVPWLSAVWLPVLVSLLTAGAILLVWKRPAPERPGIGTHPDRSTP